MIKKRINVVGVNCEKGPEWNKDRRVTVAKPSEAFFNAGYIFQ